MDGLAHIWTWGTLIFEIDFCLIIKIKKLYIFLQYFVFKADLSFNIALLNGYSFASVTL